MKPLIIDNFLSEDYFNLIRNIMLGENIAWFYMDRIDYADDVDKFQFIHSFYAKGNWASAYGNIFGSSGNLRGKLERNGIFYDSLGRYLGRIIK